MVESSCRPLIVRKEAAPQKISPLFAYEWPSINAIQNIACEVVSFDVVDESLHLGIRRAKDSAEY